METTRGEGAEVLPQQRVVLGSGQVLDHRASVSSGGAAPSAAR
jgi:hypothetical protein